LQLTPQHPNFGSAEYIAARFASVLGWNATSGRVYSVWCSTNLLSGFQCLETNIPWTAGCFTDAVHHANGQLFYKLDARIEE
jgi:hypothetical protein